MFRQVGGMINFMEMFLWGKNGLILWGDIYGGRLGYGSFESGKVVETWWEPREGAPPRLVEVNRVHMDTRVKLVVEKEVFVMFKQGKVELELEVKMTFTKEFDRIK